MDMMRHNIDEIDSAILALLAKRLGLAKDLGEAKKNLGIPIYDPAREKAILARLVEENRDRLAPAAVKAIWREIFSSSRQAQTPVRVAFLGPEGTFTQQAALARFGSSADMVATQSIAAAFAMVQNGTVNFAVLPVENTLHGIVGETVDLLGATGLPLIVGEIVTPIHFVFAAHGNDVSCVKKIYSKQESFLQCSGFLNQPALAKAERIPSTSTAEAARQAAADPNAAALCPDIAATLAGVPIRFRHIENNARNKTRFLVLGHTRPGRTDNDKTSVFAKVPNVSGGLVTLLKSFSDHGINLTKIESRPMDDAVNFETWFYIDLDGHIDEPNVKALIERHKLVWLGSYRRYVEDDDAPAQESERAAQ